MNYKTVGRIISQILSFEAVFMVPALILCFIDGDYRTASAFAVTVAIILLISVGGMLLCRNEKKNLFAKEGVVSVALAWIFMSLLGCLPFCLSGEIPNFIDAFFEMVSGFSTTGASVVENVEALTRGSLYWRSFSHWVGGMGVLVFLLAIAPAGNKNNGSSMHLLRAESPGPTVGKIVPRMKKNAKILYLLYIVLTLVNIVFLLLGGMSLFEAVCTAFGTAGTGGFGIRSDSIASHSPYIQNVCAVFMLLFGVNFGCFYLLLVRRFKDVFHNSELRLYIGMVFSAVILIVLDVRGMYDTFSEALRHSLFQVASVITTTGYATTNYDTWPSFSKAVLLCLMMTGACAGSTAGGIKLSRVVLIFKSFARSVKQTIRPQKVQVIKNNCQIVDEKIIYSIGTYLIAYVVIVVISFIIVSIDGFSVTTNLSAVMACFNNVGPGFEAVGPAANYSQFSVLSKLVLIFDMLAGRLEIFPILALFTADAWKKM